MTSIKQLEKRLREPGLDPVEKKQLNQLLKKLTKDAERKAKRATIFSVAELKARGWSSTMIEKLMPEPDEVRDNPYVKSAPKMKFFFVATVKKIERRKSFQKLREKAATRSQNGHAVADRKRIALLETVNDLPIEVKVLPLDEVEALGKEQWRSHKENQGEWVSGYPGDIDRLTVNFIRHNLTKYDLHIFAVVNQVGKEDALLRLQERVFDAIASAYPDLEAECNRQFFRKQEILWEGRYGF